MKRVLQAVVVAMLSAQVLAIGQGVDVAKLLADVRRALGGDATLSSVRTVAVEGQRTRVGSDGGSQASPFEIAMELPDRFVRREVLANFNGMALSRITGFDGAALVEKVDTPPMGPGGHVALRMGPSGMVGGDPTPEQLEAQRAATLLQNRREFSRLSLGMFARSFPVYPLDLTYAGMAESPDGRAHVIEVTGEGGLLARWFIDTTSHLPLMLSWTAKEPLRMNAGGEGGVQVFRRRAGQQEPEEIRRQMEDQRRAAEASRRMVEYRLFYADYKVFDGVKLPTRIQRMVDGQPVEELRFEKVRINGTLDPKLFER